MRRFVVFTIFLVLMAANGCGGNSASSGSNASIVVSVTPAKADVDAGNTVTFSYTVTGDPKYGGASATLSGAGNLVTTGPDFFSNYSTVYTAPGSPVAVNPTSIAGTSASITVASKTDGSRNVVVPISLHDNIQLPAQTPAVALAGKPYSYALMASGGTGTLTFALLSTSTPLPPGLTLSTAGVLSGTPTATGTYPVQIIVTDQATRIVGFSRTITFQVS